MEIGTKQPKSSVREDKESYTGRWIQVETSSPSRSHQRPSTLLQEILKELSKKHDGAKNGIPRELNIILPRFLQRPLRRLRAAFFFRPVDLLELDGAQIAQRRVHPGAVTYDLDVLEQIQRRLVTRGIDPYVHSPPNLTGPTSNSMAALSHSEDIGHRGAVSCSRMVLESSSNTYCKL